MGSVSAGRLAPTLADIDRLLTGDARARPRVSRRRALLRRQLGAAAARISQEVGELNAALMPLLASGAAPCAIWAEGPFAPLHEVLAERLTLGELARSRLASRSFKRLSEAALSSALRLVHVDADDASEGDDLDALKASRQLGGFLKKYAPHASLSCPGVQWSANLGACCRAHPDVRLHELRADFKGFLEGFAGAVAACPPYLSRRASLAQRDASASPDSALVRRALATASACGAGGSASRPATPPATPPAPLATPLVSCLAVLDVDMTVSATQHTALVLHTLADAGCGRLRLLRVRTCEPVRVSADALRALLCGCPALEAVQIPAGVDLREARDGRSASPPGAVPHGTYGLRVLEMPCVAGAPLAFDAVEQLPQLLELVHACPRLEALALRELRLTDAQVASLLAACPALVRLDLAGCSRLEFHCLDGLAADPSLGASLRYLHLLAPARRPSSEMLARALALARARPSLHIAECRSSYERIVPIGCRCALAPFASRRPRCVPPPPIRLLPPSPAGATPPRTGSRSAAR